MLSKMEILKALRTDTEVRLLLGLKAVRQQETQVWVLLSLLLLFYFFFYSALTYENTSHGRLIFTVPARATRAQTPARTYARRDRRGIGS